MSTEDFSTFPVMTCLWTAASAPQEDTLVLSPKPLDNTLRQSTLEGDYLYQGRCHSWQDRCQSDLRAP